MNCFKLLNKKPTSLFLIVLSENSPFRMLLLQWRMHSAPQSPLFNKEWQIILNPNIWQTHLPSNKFRFNTLIFQWFFSFLFLRKLENWSVMGGGGVQIVYFPLCCLFSTATDRSLNLNERIVAHVKWSAKAIANRRLSSLGLSPIAAAKGQPHKSPSTSAHLKSTRAGGNRKEISAGYLSI